MPYFIETSKFCKCILISFDEKRGSVITDHIETGWIGTLGFTFTVVCS